MPFELINKVKASGLTVLLYTGFEKEQINETAANELIKIADIVILGRYVEALRSTYLKWRGSTNQEIIVNNPMYTPILRNLEEQNELELHIDGESGVFHLLGYPNDDLLSEVMI